MEATVINFNVNDFDEIRKQLTSKGLVYPPDSTDPRYKAAFEILKEFGCTIEVRHNYSFDKLGDENDPIATKAQCRQENSNQDRVDELADRFSAGEKLINPVIGIEDDKGFFFPGIGNQRSKACKQAGVTTSVIVVGANLDLQDRIVLVAKLAAISNRRTKLDVNTDSTEDIKYQMQNQWDLVMNVNLNSTSLVSSDLRVARQEYETFQEEDDALAEQYKRDWLFEWLKKEKPYFLSPNNEKAERSFAIYYADTFKDTRRQALSTEYHKGKIPETYNAFWSDINPETGEYINCWDPESNSYENDTKTVQTTFGGGNPKQNSMRTIHDNAWNGKRTESLEVCVRPSQHLRDLESLSTWRTSILDHYKKYNNRRYNLNTGDLKYPVVSKIIFPQHFTSDDQDKAFVWVRGTGSGIFKEVQKKLDNP